MAKRTKARGGAPTRGYDAWTVVEMRRRLVRRPVEELRALLRYERATRARWGALHAIERALELAIVKERPASRGPAPGATEAAGALDQRALEGRLSELLEHERGTARLCELGLEKLDDVDLRERLAEILEQTRARADALGATIRALGGEPEELSESAELEHQRGEALLDVDAETDAGRLVFFENLYLAQVVSHVGWEVLAKAVARAGDDEVTSLLAPYVEAPGEEDERARWARRQLSEYALAVLFPEKVE
jgi:hypothetical protein